VADATHSREPREYGSLVDPKGEREARIVRPFHLHPLRRPAAIILAACLTPVLVATSANADVVRNGSVDGTPGVANPLQIRNVSAAYDYTTGTVDLAISLFGPLPAPSLASEGSIRVVVTEKETVTEAEEAASRGKEWRLSILIGGQESVGWDSAAVATTYEAPIENVPVAISADGEELSLSIADPLLVEDGLLQCFSSESSWASSATQVLPATFFSGFSGTCLPEYLAEGNLSAEGAPKREAERQAKLAAERSAQQAKEAAEQVAREAEALARREAVERQVRQEEAAERAKLDAFERLERTPKRTVIRCVIPALKGDSLSAARRKLRKAGCKLGRVTTPHGQHGALVVVWQSPARGKRFARATSVALGLAAAKGDGH